MDSAHPLSDAEAHAAGKAHRLGVNSYLAMAELGEPQDAQAMTFFLTGFAVCAALNIASLEDAEDKGQASAMLRLTPRDGTFNRQADLLTAWARALDRAAAECRQAERLVVEITDCADKPPLTAPRSGAGPAH